MLGKTLLRYAGAKAASELSFGVGAANAQKANQGEGAHFPGVHGSLQDAPLGLGGMGWGWGLLMQM